VAIDAARTKKIKFDKDQIAAQARSMRDKLTHGTYAYAAAELPFEVRSGTLKLKPVALASKGAETTINGYVELASLRVDSEWVMRLSGSGSADVPPVSLVLAGPLSDAGAITPSFDTAPVETYLTMRRMQEDVERLETLDVNGGNQPPADAEHSAETPPESKRSAETPVEAKRSSDAKRPTETPAEAKRSSAAAPKSSPSTKAPPVAAATPPAPEKLPWRQNSDNPPQAQPETAPAAGSPVQPTPAAAVGDDATAPAAPRAPSRTRSPTQTPQEPSDWKKGVGIFGGG
jgi:hypothetical protein